MANTLLDQAQSLQDQLITWRREFHRHPEVGFHEHWTSERVAQILEQLGYRVKTGVGRMGVVGEIGPANGSVLAIRADMDALAILEKNDFPHASENPGFMHACGHDAHIAMALGAAQLLVQKPLRGRVRFLFQPSEEVNDAEGLSGASRMIADGVMTDVRLVVAQHVDPQTPVGQIRIAGGPFSGGVDSFFATIQGVGGHGAWPHTTVDPITIAGHVILALQGIVSRRLDPFAPAVVSLGSIHAGQAENVIPEHVEMTGTLRYTDHAVQRLIHSEIKRVLEIARTLGGDYELDIQTGTPPMINHTGAVDMIVRAAQELIGLENVLPPVNNLGAEDFGCFSEVAPGAMYALGCKIEGDERFLHSPSFDLDERCLVVGTAVLAEVAWMADCGFAPEM